MTNCGESRIDSSLTLAMVVVLLSCAGGCQQGNLVKATSLPPEFHAPRTRSVAQIDLTRLGNLTANSEILQPGDEITLLITTGLEEDKSEPWKGRIAPDGTLNVPLIGQIRLAGLHPAHAEQVVRQESIRRRVYVNPSVSLALSERRSNTVTIVGAVSKPGTYQLPVAKSDLLTAIVEAGGLTDNADTFVEIQNPAVLTASEGGPTQLAGYNSTQLTTPRPIRVDLEQASLRPRGDHHLQDGATVMVVKQPERVVHVIGLVRTPGQYEMPKDRDLHLLDALAEAGDRSVIVANKIHVIRQVAGQTEPVIITTSIGQAKRDLEANVKLAPGDVVSVEQTPATATYTAVREFTQLGISVLTGVRAF